MSYKAPIYSWILQRLKNSSLIESFKELVNRETPNDPRSSYQERLSVKQSWCLESLIEFSFQGLFQVKGNFQVFKKVT